MKFTGEFYGALVDGHPVDQAVSSARKSLLDGFRDEWATPVLFLRAPDGNIFENVHAGLGRRTRASPTRYVRGLARPPVVLEVRRATLVRRSPPAGARRCRAGRRARGRRWSSPNSSGDDDVPVTGVAPARRAAAGGGWRQLEDLHVFRFDATTGEVGPKSLTTGTTNEFNPVLSPDRTTMIYSRKRRQATSFGRWGSAGRATGRCSTRAR